MSTDESTILRTVFNKYDVGHKGYLSIAEFVHLLTGLSKHVNELKGVEIQKAMAVFSLLDNDVDGKLSFSEFRQWWEKQNRYDVFCGEKAALLRKAYQLFSDYTKNSQDSLTFSGFSEMISELGLPECDELSFDNLDLNYDGKLSFEEFCKWLHWF